MKPDELKEESQVTHTRKQLLDFYDQSQAELTQEDYNFESNLDQSERYQERECIGQGGMKKVYRVFDAVTERYVALAEPVDLESDENYPLFQYEARLNAQLQHSNIISVHDIGMTDEGIPWFSMDLKSGESFAKKIDMIPDSFSGPENTLKYHELLKQFFKVCDAIQYAHSKGIVHLDLKPDNVQIGECGEVLVCDWGLGLFLGKNPQGEDSPLQETMPDRGLKLFKDSISGTPGYMAPEQIKKNGVKDFRTDIYSLGALLYTFLTGHSPLTKPDIDDLSDDSVFHDIVFPKERFPDRDIPKSLDAIVRKAMSLDSEKRYATVEEMVEDLSSYMAGYVTKAEEAQVFRRLLLFYKRNKVAIRLVAIFLLLISGTSYLYQEYTEEQLRVNNLRELYRNEIYRLTDFDVYSSPKKSLESTIAQLDRMQESAADEEFVYSQQGYAFYLMQRFPDALKIYDKYSPKIVDLHPIARKMSAEYPNAHPIPVKGLVSVINEMDSLHANVMAIKMMLYDAKIRKDISEHSKVVEAVLKRWNPEWESAKIEYVPDYKYIKFSGNKFNFLKVNVRYGKTKKKVNVPINLLETLPIDTIDFRDCPFYGFEQFRFLPHVKKVIVKKGVHGKAGLERLSKFVLVEEV